MPAASQALASTVCPYTRPARVAVSKLEKGWNGLRLMSARSLAALRKPWSKKLLCPTSTARLQPCAFTALRTGSNTPLSAVISPTAPRSGLLGSMPVKSSAACSILAPGKGST